jgi:iduronate 2-sulfatase
MVIGALALLWLLPAALGAAPAVGAPAQKNVLFFVCDDLRPQLNKAYGKSFMHTPNFDKFASEALVFNRAYTNFGICSASRNSFMTGRQPDHTRVWNFRQDFREAAIGPTGLPGSQWVTLPQYFKESGFLTLGHGKLYHPNKPPKWDEPFSWSPLQPYGDEYVTGCKSANFCPSNTPPAKLSDRNTTLQAIATLQRMAAWVEKNNTPFFLGVGMHFPHQAWATEARFMDFYPAASALDPPLNPYSPLGAPDIGFTAELDGDDHVAMDFSSPILGNRTRDPKLPRNATAAQSYPVPSPGNNTVPPFFTNYMRLGYYTAVSTSDEHFGMVLDALEASGQAANTIVVLFGDHGWQLGEHTLYGKHTNFDLSAHVPLLIKVPWKPAAVGQHTETVVELLDLYRTLSSLAGLPPPPADVEGKDFSAVFDSPQQQLFTEAYSQYSRCPGERNFPQVSPLPDWALNNCEDVPVVNITYMGYSVRTLEYRLTQWYSWDKINCVAEWDPAPYAVELYNHTGHEDPGDFDGWENENIAAQAPDVVRALEAKLLARFKTKGTGCPKDQPGSLEVH